MGAQGNVRNNIWDVPEGDLYVTPKSLLWVAKNMITREIPIGSVILEPCFGYGDISQELMKWGYGVVINDMYTLINGKNYLTEEEFDRYTYVVTNPPFSHWDLFVERAKQHCKKFIVIGKINYFGTFDRWNKKLWTELKSVYVFNRYVDYRTPSREDGLFHVGAMATGWFIWERGFVGDATLHVLDVQQYAKLGAY